MNKFYKDVIDILLECNKDDKCCECNCSEKCSIIFGSKKLYDISKADVMKAIYAQEKLLEEYGKDFK